MNERIKRIRTDAELTQQQFAERIKVKRNTVATYEMGRSVPSDAAIALICKEFHVREQWLRDGTGEMYSVPDDLDSVIDGIRAEPDDPAYTVALDVLRAYQALDDSSKSMLRGFAAQLLNDKKDRES